MLLPDEVIRHCREVLLRCKEFDTRENLRAVFISAELYPFRTGLPDAISSELRLDLFLDYILERRLTNGQAAFPIFVATLRDRHEAGLKEDLALLLEEIQKYEQQAPVKPSIPAETLHEKLMALDFKPQSRLFRDVIEQHRIGAFLVHGPPEHGQKLLTRRLIQSRSDWATGQRIVIDASANGIGKSPRALWRQVAEKLGMPYDTDKQILTEKVCEWWKTQSVIFVFLTVDYIPQDLLSAWLDEFWKPIATAARQREALTPSGTHLLLFLVDFSGHVCETGLSLLEQPADMAQTHAPLKLPPTRKIGEDDLEDWFDIPPLLPSKMNAAALIGATEDGIPELLYEKIFAFCGLNWEGEKLP